VERARAIVEKYQPDADASILGQGGARYLGPGLLERSKRMSSRVSLVWVVAVAAVALPAEGQQALPLTDRGWELKGASATLERVDGRDVLSVESGFAYRRDVRLQDGSIDFDVQLTRRRSFVYVMFRMADDREYEEIYLRPHKSSLPDAVQYAPVYQGASAWQLYHGPGATAPVAFEPGAWTHVRVVLSGEKAALFVGDAQQPVLVVPRLARASVAGYLALRGFAPPGSGSGPVARFANVSITPGAPAFDFASARKDAAPDQAAPAAGPAVPQPGAVRAWSVSRAFEVPKGTPAPPALPAAGVLGAWARVEALPSGLVELHRHVKLPSPETRDVAAVARVRVRAATAGVRRFEMGFSDVATVFLNGHPLFQADAHYSYDNPRQEGLVHYGQASVFLPLEQGDNDLAVLVSDGFGGWGLMGRFADATGLELDAR
jgi:hypothetical protein